MRRLELSRYFLRRDISISPLHRHCDLLLFCSTTTTATSSANAMSPKLHFMAEYLVSTCGLSKEAAAKAAKPLAHLTSTAQTDAVLAFLRSEGFDAGHIRKLATGNPTMLRNKVSTTLSPKFQALRALGFDHSDLADLVAANPQFFNLHLHRGMLPRITFWLDFFGSTKLLTKCFSRKTRTLSASIDKISQNVSLLRSFGIPDSRIISVLRMTPSVIDKEPDKFLALVDRVEACGIPRSSGLFIWGLFILHCINERAFQAKKKNMMSLGWSEEQFLTTFCRAPLFLSVSEELMRRKVEFLKGKAGYTTEDLVEKPTLLMRSLDKRMIPRYRTLELLKSKGVDIGKVSIAFVMKLTEANFIDRYILKHAETLPELLQLYTSMCRRGGSADSDAPV